MVYIHPPVTLAHMPGSHRTKYVVLVSQIFQVICRHWVLEWQTVIWGEESIYHKEKV
jgi:hypothetical protein